MKNKFYDYERTIIWLMIFISFLEFKNIFEEKIFRLEE